MAAIIVVLLILVSLPFVVGAFISGPRYRGPVTDHFDGKKFFTPGGAPPHGLSEVFRWMLGRKRSPWKPDMSLPSGKRPLNFFNDGIRITFINHSTFLLQVEGINILTDPVWSSRTSPFSLFGPRRMRPPGIKLEDLPRIDYVLLSHNHYDHLDLDTLERLWKRDRPIIVTPLGNGALMARRGITAVARDWGESVGITGDISVTVERVQHWSTRWRYDVNRALWGGFTVSTPGGNVYFAGDCGYSDAFAETARLRGPYRLALLPVGAYEPRWFMKPQHMNPAEAVQAFRDLGAQTAIGIHWGVWQLTDEGINEPRRDLAIARQAAGIEAERFQALEPGQTLRVPAVADAPTSKTAIPAEPRAQGRAALLRSR
jgi:L-ascorbate metabolism protein UlaG (beta-lactamase superfamily)